MPIYALVDTWNASGTTFTAIKMNVTDTASAAGSLLLDLQVGGVSQSNIDKTGILFVRSDINIGASNQVSLRASDSSLRFLSDTILLRDTNDTLAQRRGTNAQAFRIYNTYTDASNFERFSVGFNAGIVQVRQEHAGSGSVRAMYFGNADLGNVFGLAPAGGLLWVTDNTYDIGASGANRPRDLHLASVAYALLGFRMGRDYEIRWTTSNSDPTTTAQLILRAGQNSTNTLCIGGTTSSFPALKRNSTALETKLADDSAFAPHAMQYLDVTDGVTAPGAATGRARIYVDSADGDLKVIFADGTIKTIVTDT
jgi:hypothetical protein